MAPSVVAAHVRAPYSTVLLVNKGGTQNLSNGDEEGDGSRYETACKLTRKESYVRQPTGEEWRDFRQGLSYVLSQRGAKDNVDAATKAVVVDEKKSILLTVGFGEMCIIYNSLELDDGSIRVM